MSDRLKELLARTRNTQMTPEEREAQRKSFAYGNTKFENERITRETVERASRNLSQRNARKFE
jgi:thioester reductase-like protein